MSLRQAKRVLTTVKKMLTLDCSSDIITKSLKTDELKTSKT